MSFESFGGLLRYLRKRASLTQRELGRLVGYSESQINKLENGERQPSVDLVSGAFIGALKLNATQQLAQQLVELARAQRNGVHPPDAVAPDAVKDWSANGAGHAHPPAIHNLPAPTTSFIGRLAEVDAVVAALGRSRLVTLTGPGGCGKTRLSLRVAEAALAGFPDGAWFVELATLASAHDVYQAVASTLGVYAAAAQPLADALIPALKKRRLLLVLDNCEHVVEACAGLADRLLRGCPGVTILATSREPLSASGEECHVVPPLPLPAVPVGSASVEDVLECESVQLFVARAQAARGIAAFRLTPGAVRAIGRICIHLDGLPLAIELAAAHTRAHSVEDILDRMSDRFGLLVDGVRTAQPRQQTLVAAIDWSYSLLLPPERSLFDQLAVFAGGWSMSAAQQVCAEPAGAGAAKAVADALKSLVHKSLVNMLVEDEQCRARYVMLETIRQYARLRLDQSPDADAVASRHAAYYLGFVEEAENGLFGAAQLHTLASLERERDNIAAALGHFTARGDAVSALRMVGALRRYWQTRGRVSEGRDCYARAMALAGDVPAPIMAKALFTGSVLAYYQNDIALSKELDRQALTIAQQLDDPWLAGQIIAGVVYSSESDEEYRVARARMETALMGARRVGSTWLLGNSLHKLGAVELGHGNLEEAARLLSASEEHLMDAGDREYTLVTRLWLGNTALKLGHLDRARRAYIAALRLCQQIGVNLAEHNSVWYCLIGLAELAAGAQQPRRMARLLGAVEREREELGGMPLLWFTALDCTGGMQRYASLAGQPADQVSYSAAWDDGRAMQLEQVVAYALS